MFEENHKVHAVWQGKEIWHILKRKHKEFRYRSTAVTINWYNKLGKLYRYQPEGTRTSGRPLKTLPDWYIETETVHEGLCLSKGDYYYYADERFKIYGMYRWIRKILWQTWKGFTKISVKTDRSSVESSSTTLYAVPDPLSSSARHWIWYRVLCWFSPSFCYLLPTFELRIFEIFCRIHSNNLDQ